ncbi:MAG: flavodoxin [Gammaproteobacteria bacterium]
MKKIGIFYGTEAGTTHAIAEVLYRLLGDDIADKPVNVSRARPGELMRYDAIIAGTPSYGIGELPGRSTGSHEGNWEEFLFRLDEPDLKGKRVALFGLGNQVKYHDRFASSLIHVYRFFRGYGAEIIGPWSTEGYHFNHSHAVLENMFVGLVIDHNNQPTLTKERIVTWLEQIKPKLLEKLQ